MPRERLEPFYGQITLAETVVSTHANSWETNLPIFVCRDPKMTLQEAWKTIDPAGF